MFLAAVQHTPHWVWIILAALIAAGYLQTFPRRRSLRRAILFPIAMICLSFYGVVSVFPAQPGALAAWAAGVTGALIVATGMGMWQGIRWSTVGQYLVVPGSWAPLFVMFGLFVLKFGVGVGLARQPELASDESFAAMIGFAYGGFSGVFLSRAVAMWKVAHAALRTDAVA
jgi:hypothetical protein